MRKSLINKQGYKVIFIPKTDKFYSMSSSGRILEHRYILAKHLNRILDMTEVIHHIDHNKRNNKLSNLVILTMREHALHHLQPSYTTTIL